MLRTVIVLFLLLSLVPLVGCTKKVEDKEATAESRDFMTEAGNQSVEESQGGTKEESWQKSSQEEALPQEGLMAPEPAAGQTAVSEPKTATDNPTTKDIQLALKNAGFYQGKIDGDLGPKTKASIRAFQKANKLAVDGKVGPRTWNKLKSHLIAAEEKVASETSSGTSY
ncbi:MAG: peptidoglycan-binding domain-containing protein [Candidatus Omnitrophica bacterium]|nr:peptidoglycan-binding domain-containing protein [Candidatus Omnitrophota bacterium]